MFLASTKGLDSLDVDGSVEVVVLAAVITQALDALPSTSIYFDGSVVQFTTWRIKLPN